MASPAYTTKVTYVEHYTESYFRFRVERPESLDFVSGQFIMLGLIVDDKPLMRALFNCLSKLGRRIGVLFHYYS